MAPRPAVAALAVRPPGAAERLTWLALAVAASAVLLTARLLDPDPAGHGTHTQLGLPPCGFLFLTGLPCPGCGLTTSFAHMARLQVTAAAMANPMGIPLFASTVASVPLCIVAARCNWGVGDTFDRFRGRWVVTCLALAAVLVWLTRIAATLFA